MNNYLNPTIIELEGLEFNGIDVDLPGASFSPANFALLNSGEIFGLNIIVKHDPEGDESNSSISTQFDDIKFSNNRIPINTKFKEDYQKNNGKGLN